MIAGLFIRLKAESRLKAYPSVVIDGVAAKLIEACAFGLFTVIILANQLDSTIMMESMIVAVILEIFAILPLGALMIVVSIVPFFLALQHNSYWPTQLAIIVALTLGHSMYYAPPHGSRSCFDPYSLQRYRRYLAG